MKPIYMDHAATTAVSEGALQEMLPYFSEEYGNPSAVYSYGQTGKNIVEKCRERVAKCIGAFKTEIYFTSCGTESDNWAIRSACRLRKDKGKHIISSEIEHNAVRRTLEQLEEDGYEVTYLKPNKDGQISVEQLEEAIREDTILITIMLANNVVGTVLNIKELAAAARKRRILFHTDAVQAVGHIPVNVHQLGVDLLSISGHKFNGPKGSGVLYCRIPLRLPAYLTGGGQEKEGRSGTENVPGIVGLTHALEENTKNLEENAKYLNEQADRMTKSILELPGVTQTGDKDSRLPGFCSFVVDGIQHSVLLVNEMNSRGVCISSGSACSASSQEASHVLLALGYDKQLAGCSVRVTLGMDNSPEDVDYATQMLKVSIEKIRSEQVSRAPRLEGRVTDIASENK
ncbi:MAG: cysteine desulfurase family protein [Eubacteriales bacterium]|nr:cysteine desulfurase family protein [Eubacteriales bacterium]